MMRQRHLFYGVLNWGLGHASRSLPLIQKYLDQGWHVTVASDGAALRYLKERVDAHAFVNLASLEIQYARAWFMPLRLMQQWPKYKKAVAEDEQILRDFFRSNKIDLVISDGRLGLVHPFIKCVLINHQLNPAPFGLSRMLSKWWLQRFSRFREIWVPDDEERSLSGKLSKAPKLRVPVKYIGPQSQYPKARFSISGKILVVVSGPNPQRRKIADELHRLLVKAKHDFTMVYGGTDFYQQDVVHMPGDEVLFGLWKEAELVISSGGYSSLMDVVLTEKKAILIPTPGQPEHMYLYRLHKGKQQNLRFLKQRQLYKLAGLLKEML